MITAIPSIDDSGISCDAMERERGRLFDHIEIKILVFEEFPIFGKVRKN